jgi:uncharacterized LabA/DUF88 family protein
MARVLTYIDGFNLYFGLRSKGWKRYLWLNLKQLAESLIQNPTDNLVGTKYFTARVKSPQDKVKRQSIFLEALETLGGVEFFYGKYLINDWTCRNCHQTAKIPNEKMTDVNIAVELLTDAFQDRFDTAYLISADSDLMPPIQAVKRLFPSKRIVAAFPPDRFSHDLTTVSDAHFTIGRALFAKCQLPEQIQKPDGFILQRPQEWT